MLSLSTQSCCSPGLSGFHLSSLVIGTARFSRSEIKIIIIIGSPTFISTGSGCAMGSEDRLLALGLGGATSLHQVSTRGWRHRRQVAHRKKKQQWSRYRRSQGEKPAGRQCPLPYLHKNARVESELTRKQQKTLHRATLSHVFFFETGTEVPSWWSKPGLVWLSLGPLLDGEARPSHVEVRAGRESHADRIARLGLR